MSRLEWLEEQIKVQEDALVTCPNEVHIHAYLLKKLTDEWCELIRTGGAYVSGRRK